MSFVPTSVLARLVTRSLGCRPPNASFDLLNNCRRTHPVHLTDGRTHASPRLPIPEWPLASRRPDLSRLRVGPGDTCWSFSVTIGGQNVRVERCAAAESVPTGDPSVVVEYKPLGSQNLPVNSWHRSRPVRMCDGGDRANWLTPLRQQAGRANEARYRECLGNTVQPHIHTEDSMRRVSGAPHSATSYYYDSDYAVPTALLPIIISSSLSGQTITC